MPELPEVETTLRGIEPHIQGFVVKDVIVRQPNLRWPIPRDLQQQLKGKTVTQLARRGKYLLITVTSGTLIIHLGMSGSLQVLSHYLPPQKHAHVDIAFSNKKILRFTDPRRFGALLWVEGNPYLHPLLINLGMEPLDKHFSGTYLWQKIHHKKVPIKSLIMDNKVVVGVGNIYAAESLFLAGIHPLALGESLTKIQLHGLARAIKSILRRAIKQGGTTLKDFVNSEGKPGYFTNQLKVYGRAGLPCVQCHGLLKSFKMGQRSTVFCESCQPLPDVEK